MKLTVHVKPRSKIESVTQLSDGSLIVRVNALPADGEANKRVQELLAKHFNCPKTKVQLISGAQSKKKIFEIP